MERRLYRPLQPHDGRLPTVFEPVEPTRKRISTACGSCRERKSKCNGATPACSSCVVRGSQCIYTVKEKAGLQIHALKHENKGLKERNTATEELLDHLRLLPENNALELLREIRMNPKGTPLSLLNSLRGDPQLRLPSANHAALGLLPRIQSGAELAFIDLQGKLTDETQPLLEPLPMAQDQNMGLETLDISFWTAVPVTNEFARVDHPTIGVFDSQLFIADLLSFNFDFCSPFLVSSLLAYASQGYSTQDATSSARGFEFEEEAERLFEAERTDSPTALSGLALLSYSHGAHGRYSDGSRKYAENAFQMGKRMKLFGVPDRFGSPELRLLPTPHQRALVSSAWGGFNTIMLLSLFHILPPTPYPPALPYPGYSGARESNNESIEQSGGCNFSTRYASETMSSALCSLWAVLSDILCFYRNPERPGTPNLAFAFSKYNMLLALAGQLPAQLIRQEHTSLSVLFFHIVFHTAVLEVFRPFLPPGKRIRIAEYLETSTASPETIFAASAQQLKSLTANCIEQQHGTATIFWAGIGLMQVANAVLRDVASSDWRHSFLFCIRSFKLLFPAFAVCKGIVRGLLAMAVFESTSMSSSEALSIMEEFQAGETFHDDIAHPTGGFVVDFDMAVQSRQDADVNVWLDKFEDMSIFSDFTQEVL
ncbi:unnamed protein product [Periconia digitata]|uniref:Zn(2)-C6 fungal-type domain-containing protein n=1 Tax=Periconia digitata TaxID=1303443 RepID=A0A9W4XPY0_9PLEO|nr:unnamed protein product [Periconia digitata]